MYRLVITLVGTGPAAQASSSYCAFAPGQDVPFAFTACLWGDVGGARAEIEGREAIARHSRGAAGVDVLVVREIREVLGDGAAALAALAVLTDELGRAHAAAQAAQPGEVTCHRGCDLCCHQRVGLSRVEIARLAGAVAAMSDERRAALAATVVRAAALDRERCGALDDEGVCQVYASRPMVCRSQGLMYGSNRVEGRQFLRVLQPSCHLNYRGEPPADEDVHDLESWNERLMEIDEQFAVQSGVGADLAVGRAIPLAEVLASLTDGRHGSP